MAIFDIFKKFKVVGKKELNSMKKGMDDLKIIQNYLRPDDENDFFSLNRSQSWGVFDTTVGTAELVQLSVYSDVLLKVHNALRNEMFRNGYKYEAKTTYENDLQLKKIESTIGKANFNNQKLTEVFMEFENDLNVLDNAYLLARKNFFVNGYNEIIGAEVQEFLRLDPMSVEMIFDTTNRLGHNKEGQPVYFNPEDRSQITKETHNENGIKNMNACYKVRSEKNTTGGKTGYQYFDSSEILHASKYHPTKTYGFSPLYSLYNKLITLINLDYYIKQYYSGDKVPKGILTVNTSNATGFMGFWDTFIEKVRRNPHSVNPLIHQSGDGKDPIKWVDFMKNLTEMQYTDVRNEIRSQVGSMFHVSPVFQNDVSTGGGLNNEGLQITVTDRGVEFGQKVYNEKVLPWMSEQMGITDYDWEILPSRDQDKVYDKDLRLKEIAIAKATAELGIKVTMNETGEFSYSAGEVELVDGTDPVQDSFFKMGKSLQKKADVIPQKQIKEVESALLNELTKLLKKFESKTRPTQAQLEKKIKETVKDFDKVMEALKKQPHRQKAFANMNANLSTQLSTVVQRAFDDPAGFSIDRMVKEMKENVGLVESDLRRIARGESSKIAMASRKVQYDKTGNTYNYFHIGPADGRTTPKKGVTWDEYVKIVTKVAKKYNPKWIVDKIAPITQPNTRHTFIARRA